MSVEPPPLRPLAILETLERHEVEYVLVGGLAATAYGSPLITYDLDLTPARTPENYRRLAAALVELDAKLRPAGAESGIEWQFDERAFRDFTTMALTTAHGWVDLVFQPDGTGGYADLVRRAELRDVAGMPLRVASLADIIHSKSTAGRPKDLQALPTLRELQRRLERAAET